MSQAKIELDAKYAMALAVLRELEHPVNGVKGSQAEIDAAAQLVIDLREQVATAEAEGNV